MGLTLRRSTATFVPSRTSTGLAHVGWISPNLALTFSVSPRLEVDCRRRRRVYRVLAKKHPTTHTFHQG